MNILPAEILTYILNIVNGNSKYSELMNLRLVNVVFNKIITRINNKRLYNASEESLIHVIRLKIIKEMDNVASKLDFGMGNKATHKVAFDNDGMQVSRIITKINNSDITIETKIGSDVLKIIIDDIFYKIIHLNALDVTYNNQIINAILTPVDLNLIVHKIKDYTKSCKNIHSKYRISFMIKK